MAAQAANQLGYRLVSPQKSNNQRAEAKGTVAIANRYGILAEIDDENDMIVDEPSISTPIQPAQMQTKAIKCPPIIVTQKVDDLHKFHKSIKEQIKGEYLIRYAPNQIKIFTKQIEDMKSITKDLKEANVQFYTHSTKEEQKKKIVLKAANFLSAEDVKTNICSQTNIAPSDIECIKMKGHSIHPHSFLVTINKSTDLKLLTNIQAIDHVRTNWQKYAKKGKVTQCHRCQQFGHGSTYCNRKPKCVKCTGSHLTEECSIKERGNGTVQCTNCHGPHTANYSQCPAYLEYLDKQVNRNQSTHQTQYKPPPTLTQYPTINRQQNNIHTHPPINNTKPLYSEITAHNPRPSNQHNASADDFQTLIKEIHELNSICNISALISLVREIKSKIVACHSPLDKIMLIQELSQKHNF